MDCIKDSLLNSISVIAPRNEACDDTCCVPQGSRLEQCAVEQTDAWLHTCNPLLDCFGAKGSPPSQHRRLARA
jgi:hypothetical protein